MSYSTSGNFLQKQNWDSSLENEISLTFDNWVCLGDEENQLGITVVGVQPGTKHKSLVGSVEVNSSLT